MFRILTRHIKQFCAAIVLLLLAVVGTELFLQLRDDPPALTVTPQVATAWQPLLAPSATVHHEMLRLHTQLLDAEHTVVTNSLGLRGEEPVQPKPAGALRVLILGDETILGAGLENTHTVTGRLQQLLSTATGQTVEVLNAGIPGYCPLLSWLQYRRELQQLRPDLVILHFDMTDVADDAVYRRALKQTADRQICVNPMLKSDGRTVSPLIRVLRNSALARLLQTKSGLAPGPSSNSADILSRYEWTIATRADLRLQIQHALDPVQQLGTLAQHSETRLLVATSPTPWQVAPATDFPTLARALPTSAAWPMTDDLPYRILAAVCERSAISLCNPTAEFRGFSQPAKLFVPDSTQLSAYGAALYAREIAATLLKEEQFASLFRSDDLAGANLPNNAAQNRK